MDIHTLEHISDEVLDELISADIDGELLAAVQDLEIGLSVSAIQLWFRTSSRASSRYAALRSASFMFGQPLGTEIDELSKRRMVKITLGHTRALPANRTRRLSMLVAASAACITLVVGIAASLSRDSESEVAKITTTSTLGASAAQRPEVGSEATLDSVTDLGIVANVQQLRTKIDALLTNSPAKSTTTIPSNGSGAERDIAGVAAQESAGAHCAASLPGAETALGLATIATAIIGNQPVEIATAIDTQGRSLRWAYRTSDCAILFADRTSLAGL